MWSARGSLVNAEYGILTLLNNIARILVASKQEQYLPLTRWMRRGSLLIR